MHGVIKPPTAATDKDLSTSKVMLFLLVLMTGLAPISLYLLVPALPVLASSFGRDISIAQMTVSLYMVGIACSQIIMGAAVGQVRPPPGAARRPRPDGRSEHRLHLRR